ncbi:MAG: 6-bladed beta-propeller [Prevotellaceae bacterium]|jgi:hypothetical protein|nr:6-bladed beta-propeller [Prevotellaceae bacterium]
MERVLHSWDLPVEELKANKIPIKETLNPVKILMLDDYFIFQNDYISGEDCFYVYSKSMKFCYSFGRLGQGPGEFIAPTPAQGSKENKLAIYDAAFDKLTDYDISDTKAEWIKDYKFPDRTIKFPVQQISYVDDTTILFRVMSNEGVMLYSYNIQSNYMIDTLSFETKIKEQMVEYNSTFDDFCFSNYGRKYVISFAFIDEVVTGTLDAVGKFPKMNYKLKHTRMNKDIADNISYYPLDPAATGDCVYTPYYGRLFSQSLIIP